MFDYPWSWIINDTFYYDHYRPPWGKKRKAISLREAIGDSQEISERIADFLRSDLPKAYIDVFPTTVLVHAEQAKQELGLYGCFIITYVTPEKTAVYRAPYFCCFEPPVDRASLCPSYSGYVNIEKCDLRQLTGSPEAPTVPEDYVKQRCLRCGKPNGQNLQHQLFALSCGHYACRACWLGHFKTTIYEEPRPILCPYASCGEQLTVSRAAPLMADDAIWFLVQFEWRNRVNRGISKDIVRCAGCKHLLERIKNSRMTKIACACGSITCALCGQLHHAPLRCGDAAVWEKIRNSLKCDAQSDLEDLLSTLTLNSEEGQGWSLSRAQIDECLLPSAEIDKEQFKKNMSSMKASAKAHGILIVREMYMVSRMLECRRVQQATQRKEMQATSDTFHGTHNVDELWETLERKFFAALDTIGVASIKAKELVLAKENILSCCSC